MSAIDDNPVTLSELAEATRDRGIVGEKENILTCHTCSICGEDVILNGPSRGGKDEILDATEWLWHPIPDTSEEIDWEMELQKGTQWYHWPSEMSAKVPFYKSPTINRFPIQRFMDFVSIDEVVEAIAKQFGEGKAATHEKVDVTLSDADGTQGQIENMVLEAPRSSFFTIASDNDKIDLRNDFEEIRKRVIVLDTDASEELTRKIQRRQAAIKSGRYEPRIDDERLGEIRDHNNNIPIKKFGEDGDGKVVDPVSEAVVMQEPIPAKFVEGRFDNLKLMDMLEGITLFYHDRRMKLPGAISDSGQAELYVAPADAFHGMKIFGENLVMSALNLKAIDKVMLKEMRNNPNTEYDVLDMVTILQAEGLNPNEDQVRNSLDAMFNKHYVRKFNEGAGRVSYACSMLGQEIALEGNEILDWEQVVEDTKMIARETMSEERAEKYIKKFCEGDALEVEHPITGEEVNILEDNELNEAAEDSVEEIESMDDPLYGGSDDESGDSREADDEQESESEPKKSMSGQAGQATL